MPQKIALYIKAYEILFVFVHLFFLNCIIYFLCARLCAYTVSPELSKSMV